MFGMSSSQQQQHGKSKYRKINKTEIQLKIQEDLEGAYGDLQGVEIANFHISIPLVDEVHER